MFFFFSFFKVYGSDNDSIGLRVRIDCKDNVEEAPKKRSKFVFVYLKIMILLLKLR